MILRPGVEDRSPRRRYRSKALPCKRRRTGHPQFKIIQSAGHPAVGHLTVVVKELTKAGRGIPK